MKSLVTFQHMLRNQTRNLTLKVRIAISCLNIQERKLTRYLELRILKASYNTTQTTIIETLN
jgi:hypothetical protein